MTLVLFYSSWDDNSEKFSWSNRKLIWIYHLLQLAIFMKCFSTLMFPISQYRLVKAISWGGIDPDVQRLRHSDPRLHIDCPVCIISINHQLILPLRSLVSDHWLLEWLHVKCSKHWHTQKTKVIWFALNPRGYFLEMQTYTLWHQNYQRFYEISVRHVHFMAKANFLYRHIDFANDLPPFMTFHRHPNLTFDLKFSYNHLSC